MLVGRRTGRVRSRRLVYHKIGSIKANIYQFPEVLGLEDVSAVMREVKAENLFSALLKGYDLSLIESEEQAQAAERFLEYLLRVFEKDCPDHVKTYLHLLEILIQDYDKKRTSKALGNMTPDLLLRSILEEEGLSQKSLVPACFKSQSQVSEFLAQKKGREKLTAEQALKLGKRFHLNPLLFLC